MKNEKELMNEKMNNIFNKIEKLMKKHLKNNKTI
jgi:hypothetical protein